MSWNSGQLQVIENTKGNMLVSASAGSGKTSVMIEREKRLVLQDKVPISRILMLSFNDAIAEEIKEKMAKALISEIKTSDDKEFLREQIDDLGTADIVTMHSFCNSLVKEYFDIVGVDPAYSIMDDKESKVVINKAINEVFDEYYESGDVDFILLKDKLSASGDDDLRSIVESVFNYSNALLNGDEWLDNAINNNYLKPLNKVKGVKYLVDDVICKVNNAIDALQSAINMLDVTKYPEIEQSLEQLLKYENEENILKYESFLDSKVEFPKNLRFKKDEEVEKEYYNTAKSTYNVVVDTIAKLYPVPYKVMELDHKADAVIVNKLNEIIKKFKTIYNREKAEVNKLDFSDMEHYAVEILSHEDIAADVRSKYDYVCVDEYQDINAVQDKVITTVSNGDNVLMVGDPKQSIYKFRFTEPEIFIKKEEMYKNAKGKNLVQLPYNYRSSPLILNYVNDVFNFLMQKPRAGQIRNVYLPLYNGLEFEDQLDCPFEVMLYEVPSEKSEPIVTPYTYRVSEQRGAFKAKKDAEIEASYIAEKISDLLGKQIYDVKSGEYRDIKYDDMAILAQSRTDTVKNILDILEKKYNIPIDSSYLKKKEEPQEVKILLDFLRAIDNPRQDIKLYTVMRIFFDFEDSDFVEMKSEVSDSDNFYNIVFDDVLTGDIKDKVDKFKEEFDTLRLMSTFMNVYDFLIKAMDVTKFKSKLLMSKNGKSSLDNIDKFLMTLKDKKHSSTIQEFLFAYDNYNIMSDVESTSECAKNSVHTTTIHKSKGLEYPIVFIVNLGTPFIGNQMSTSQHLLDKDLGFAVKTFNETKKTVYSNWLIDSMIMKKTKEESEERMRLLYVAMTRAKNCLYMTGKINKKKNSVEETKKYTDWLWYVAENNDEFAKCLVYKEASDYEALDIDVEDRGPSAFDYEDYSSEDAKEYHKVFDFAYPYEDATKLAQKYTVTAINHEERENEEYVKELYETEKTSTGSIYHKFMEHVNYEADTIDAIKVEMARMVEEKILTEDEISVIDINDVYKCLNSAIIKKAKVNKHDREKKFMMHLPLSDVKEGASDEKVIVQGIADLVIYGEENILVDFKKSTMSTSMLKETYRKQLDIYKFALEKSMDITFSKMYLYVIGRDEIIDMTK